MTRDAAAIGAGLTPAREARPIANAERIHVVGVAGAGASAAALLGHMAGAVVTGCDSGGPSPYTLALEAAGIPLAWQHDPEHVRTGPPPDRIAVTKALTAIDPDNSELAAARAAGLPVEPWQQVVADAAIGRTLVGVSGTHGKSTTSGWLVHVLVMAGLDPTAFVGALLSTALTGGAPSTARWGEGAAFVVEADEYAGNFDAYRPDIAILTSVEWDHPDVFSDEDAVVSAFASWLHRMPAGATVVANVGDPGVLRVLAAVSDPVGIRALPYRLIDADDPDATTPDYPGIIGRIVDTDRDGTTLEVGGLEAGAGSVQVRIGLAGRHNAANALAVAGAAMTLGVPTAAIVTGLASFGGVGRRLERKGEARGVVVYDDYGHHPTAIRETIGAIRQREPGRRVWAVYEPLTYHRTAALLPAFAEALATADAVVVADIWAGRDPDTTVASASGLADAVGRVRPGIPVAAPGSVESSADWLAHEVVAGDAVLVMGGGQSYRIATGLLQRLEASEGA